MFEEAQAIKIEKKNHIYFCLKLETKKYFKLSFLNDLKKIHKHSRLLRLYD